MKYKFSPLAIIITLVLFEHGNAIAEDLSIERITVTGTRTQMAVKELTSNSYHVDQEQIALVEHEHINQIMNSVPGAWISRGNGQEHLTSIRSPVLTGAGGCGAFYMAQDGISLRAPGFCNANQLFDVNSEQAARVEVINGAASTQYGSNAVHGVINILTPDIFTEKTNYLSAKGGPHDYARIAGSYAKAEGQHAVNIYGVASHDGGYKDSSGYEQQKLNFIHQFEDGKWSIKNVVAATHLNQETAGFITGFEAYKDGALKKQNPNPDAYRDAESIRAYSLIDIQLSEIESISFKPFIRYNEMTFLQHYLPWQATEENSQLGVGFQSQYEKKYSHGNLLIGLDVDWTQGELTEYQAEPFAPTLPQGTHYDYEVFAQVYSPFVMANWQVNNKISINSGLRFDYTNYDYDNLTTNGNACQPDVQGCRFFRPADQTVSFNEWSYQLGANYQLDDSYVLFSQFATGHRAPQATELFRLQAGQQVADLAAEQITSVEIGIRGQLESLYIEATTFAMEKDNFIFQDTNRFNVSDGETTHYGVEFLALYDVNENWYIQASGTVANHRYQGDLTLSRGEIDGNEIDTAPQHMGNVQLGWKNNKDAQLVLEWQHMGNYYLNPENTATYAGHNLLNLRVSKQLTPEIKLNAQWLNALNEDYAERADFGFGSYRYFVGEPSSLYISIKYQFN